MGTIDKYIGDAIMAFWNAPLDDPLQEVNACEAALETLARTDKRNQQFKHEAEIAQEPSKTTERNSQPSRSTASR